MSRGVSKEPFRFTWLEFSGALGDLGLFIPLVVGMTISCDLQIGMVLIMAGLMNIVTGFLFRQPIPVQPMKALAIIVIAEGMLKDELFASGIIMGLALIFCSFFIKDIIRLVPKAIVRGVQLGVGLKLALKGVQWIFELPLMGVDSIASSVLVVILLAAFLSKNKPGLVVVFALGFLILLMDIPEDVKVFSFGLPQFGFYFPELWAFKTGFVKGFLPQFPLTILNSVVAVCVLSEDYFPKKGVSPRRMAFSVGMMNLISIPFGGVPMCHGAGGLAAQHRFGARTGGSVIMLGILKVGVGLFLGETLFYLLQSYPTAVLGPMLVFAGVELAKVCKDSFNKYQNAYTVVFNRGGYYLD